MGGGVGPGTGPMAPAPAAYPVYNPAPAVTPVAAPAQPVAPAGEVCERVLEDGCYLAKRLYSTPEGGSEFRCVKICEQPQS